MLITRSQGAACRRAAERIAEGESFSPYIIKNVLALCRIGWCATPRERFTVRRIKSQVLMALLWCATIAGEE